jgi:hypothetical protein
MDAIGPSNKMLGATLADMIDSEKRDILGRANVTPAKQIALLEAEAARLAAAKDYAGAAEMAKQVEAAKAPAEQVDEDQAVLMESIDGVCSKTCADDYCTLDELCKFSKSMGSRRPEVELRKVVQRAVKQYYDKDGDGFVSRAEFTKAVTAAAQKARIKLPIKIPGLTHDEL